MTYAAVIFDLDGTLLDTESVAIAAAKSVFHQLDKPVEDAFLLSMIGKDHATCDAMILDRFPGLDLARLTTLWDDEIRKRYANGIPLRPTADTLLTDLAKIGTAMAIATSSLAGPAARKLAKTGIDRFFDIVISADDVTCKKPAPDPYILAATRLGVPPEACLAFEDSLTGVASAHAAGMTVVHVPDLDPTPAPLAHFSAETILVGAQRAGLLA